MAAYTYVDQEAQLRRLAQEWRKRPAMAVDLEMEAHLHHYGVHLALIQLADDRDVWIVDPLAIKDLGPIVSLFEDPRVLKVFHDVSFDFRILDEVLGCRPKNVFDTKVAALLLGKDSISLAGLFESYYGIKKDEHYQRVDWLRRPLDQGMLSYAAGDVAPLLRLQRQLERELRQKDRWHWAEQEFAWQERQRYVVERKTYQDVKGAKSMTDQERGVLREFFKVREEFAKKVDRPVFFIIPDNLLVELAKKPPRSEQEWRSLPRVHPVVKRQAFRLVKALRSAKPAAKERGEPRRRLTPRQGQEVQALLQRRDRVAERLGVENFVILTREQAEQHVLGQPMQARSWQRSLLGL